MRVYSLLTTKNRITMKKTIKRKTYDTDTATEIGTFHNGASYTDFNYMYEKLYRSEKGNFFIVGEGGPSSKYGQFLAGGGRTGRGDVFLPLTDEEAYKWLEKHGDQSDLEHYFGHEIEEA